MRKLLAMFLLCGMPCLAYSQQYAVHLQAGSFVPGETIDKGYAATELINGRYYRYIQFYEIPTAEQKKDLEAKGIRLLSYLPTNVFIASINPQVVTTGFINKNIRSIFSVTNNYKLGELLLKNKLPAWALRGEGKIELTVSYQEDLDGITVRNLLQEKGFQVLHLLNDAKALRVLAKTSEINNLASLNCVMFVEPADGEPVAENLVGVTSHRSNTIATSYPGGTKYDGTGVIVALNDDGVIGPHIDYQGRLISTNITFNNGNHGDHCAGTIFGAGNRNPIARGMAYGAKLQVYGVSNQFPTQYQAFDSVTQIYAQGVRITSTSYGNGDNTGYTALARTMDVQINDRPELMHVFSAGNSGSSNFNWGAGAGWANVTGGHKQAKNVTTVGNVLYTDVLAASSSRGPARDGRIKPDICAVGTDVYSTIDPNTYENKTGTSMACPGIAGIYAQLYSGYKSLNAGVNPPSALMKAVMLNTADDLGNPGPDFRFGYGRVNARRAMNTIQTNRYRVDSVTQGISKNHTITVPANTAEMRVMVYWHDYQATAGATRALVNNLNMTVTTPAAATVLPWVLNGSPSAAAVSANAVRGLDSLNNMEQVTIAAPAAGTYTVNVNGFAVPQGPQKYYLVYEFVTDDVVLTYPIGGESLVPGVAETIRWDAYEGTGSFTLQYSLDNGSSWVNIASPAATARYYNWTPPAAATGKALVKVSRGTSSDQSNAPFSIIGIPAGLIVNWVCLDSMKVSYNPVTNATGYVVRILGNQYMDSVGTSTTTSCVVKGINTLSGGWITVQALGANEAIGRRANAVSFAAAPFNCAIPNDLGMVSYTSPTSNAFMSCTATSLTDSVKVVLRNNGLNPFTNFTLSYSVNNGTPVSVTYPGSVGAGAFLNYTFAQPITFSTAGLYTIKTWLAHPSDFTNVNDTIVQQKNIVFSPTVSLPVRENFETFTLCDTFATCQQSVCQMMNGWVNAANMLDDSIDWRTNSGPTPSFELTSMTGPQRDYAPGSATGKYVYLEGDACERHEAHLISPCINLIGVNNPELKFAYHMFGGGMGQLHLDIFANGAWTNNAMSVLSGNKGNSWQTRTVNLSGYAGRVINIRFRGITGATFESDMALDDISVVNNPNSVPGMNTPVSYEVFPNPSKNIFNIRMSNVHSAVTLLVTDISGKIVEQRTLNARNNALNTAIDLSHAASGVYFLSLQNEQGKVNQKLIKL